MITLHVALRPVNVAAFQQPSCLETVASRNKIAYNCRH